MTGRPVADPAAADKIIVSQLDGPLIKAGFVRSPTQLNWSWTGGVAFVALSALAAVDENRLAYSLMVGWRFDVFADPQPDPVTAHGCSRAMTFDELAPAAGRSLGAIGVADDRALEDFDQRLAATVRQHVVRWVGPWKRPDGYRDFLASKNYHLAAAWASALLGHNERARLELAYAAHLFNQPLDGSFDRMRADHDGALASVFAARNGLSALLEAGDDETVAAFSSQRGTIARDKVIEPQAEHRRLRLRHAALSETCLLRVQQGQGGGT